MYIDRKSVFFYLFQFTKKFRLFVYYRLSIRPLRDEDDDAKIFDDI